MPAVPSRAPTPAPTREAAQPSLPSRSSSLTPARASQPPSLMAAGPGESLAEDVRARLEQGFGADLRSVRVHQGDAAARLARNAGARAFATGSHIVLGAGESPRDVSLLSHEVAHVLQQGASSVVRKYATTPATDAYEQEAQHAATVVSQGGTVAVGAQPGAPGLQRLGLSDVLDYFADKANVIPGFRLLTILLGVNPINMKRVERSAANILRAVIEFIPGGALITQALDNYGIFERVGTWVEDQLRALGSIGASIRDALDRFLSSLGWSDIFHLGDVWDRAKRIFSEPIDRILSTARSFGAGIIKFIKDTILRPLAALAEGTRAYPLLKAVLGRDPITGEPVPRTAETLIGGFMTLIGQEEVWTNLQESRAVPRAWAWFQGTLQGLLGFVSQLPALFLQAFRALELLDIVLVPRAFVKLVKVFGGFVGQFISWAGSQVLSLLQIIFEVLAPPVVPYLRKAAGAFRTIIGNPIGFIKNLVRAGVQGFRQFASNFLTHLKTSLIGWLTGTLAGANIYIPQAFTVVEILKLVLSVLGLTWQNIRQKLVRVIGETAVKVLETGFDIVVTLVREGPAAAWEKIQESLTNLREMVMGQVMSFVTTRIVQAAITKLLTSLNPAGAFIQAIIAIYNTIMFFVERLRQIAQVAAAIIDAISAIASGVITAAANKVESTLGGLLTLVISFLARLVGLGKVSDVVKDIVDKIRTPIDKALDRVVAWVVAQAKKLGKLVVTGAKTAAGRLLQWWRTRRRFSAPNGQSHSTYFQGERRSARLFVESTPSPFETFIQSVPATNPARGRALLLARQMDDLRNRANPADGTLSDADLARLEALWDPFSRELAQCFTGAAASAPQYGPPASPAGWGSGMVIVRLASGLRGSAPSVGNPTFHDLNLRRHGTASSPGAASYYILGHLLNEQLGGPGNTWSNITPLSRTGNAQHDQKVESALRAPVGAGRQFKYEVQVRYGRGASGLLGTIPANTTDPVLQNKRKVLVAEQHVPSSLLIRAVELPLPGGAAPSVSITTEVPNAVDQSSLDAYVVPGQAARRLTVLSINDSIKNIGNTAHREALLRLPGVGPARIDELVAQGPYAAWADIATRVNGITAATLAAWRAGLDGARVQLSGATTWV